MIAELAHGFELSRNPADGRPWTVVVDKLSPKQPGFIAQEIRFLKQLTNKRIKATLPAPALLGERMWDPVKSSKASKDSRWPSISAVEPVRERAARPSIAAATIRF